jgi:hypothetical protein
VQWHLDGAGTQWPKIFAAEPVLTGDVVIVLCTPTMREWAHRFMHRSVLVMDSTFGLNKHGYSLFVALAIGEHSNGVPVCFFITKSESTESITIALKQFVRYLDEGRDSTQTALTRPSTTMTDDSAAEQAALRYENYIHESI